MRACCIVLTRGERELCCHTQAVRGGGAFLNGKRISVSQASEIGQALVSTNIGYGRGREVTDFMVGNVRMLLEQNVRGLRMTGSGTLSLARSLVHTREVQRLRPDRSHTPCAPCSGHSDVRRGD